MYLGFRPLPSELPFLHKRSAPRFVLVRLKQESRVSKIIDIISPPSSRLKRFWTTDEKRTQKITRSLDKTKICPVTTPCFYKDRSHFRKFQWDLQYFPCDLRYVTESSLFIWRLGSRAEVSVHAWRGSTVKKAKEAASTKRRQPTQGCCGPDKRFKGTSTSTDQQLFRGELAWFLIFFLRSLIFRSYLFLEYFVCSLAC